MTDCTSMRNAFVVAALAGIFFGPVAGTVRAAGDPFAGTSWLAVLHRDPGVKLDRDTSTPGHDYFETSDRVGGYFSRGNTTVTGRAGGEWIAAVPLDTGGTIGYAGYLLYHPHVAKHFAVVTGTDGLRFEHDRVVTVDATDRATRRGIERTFSIHGDRVIVASTRRIELP